MKLKTFYLISLVVLSSFLFWYNATYSADTLASFYADEIPNTQSSVSFFTKGVYQNDRDDLIYSSGIATTWPSAVGWSVGHSLLFSRLGCIFFSWAFGLWLGYLFFTRQGYSHLEAITVAVCLWAVLSTTPLAFPYWHGFVYNLGEFNAILLIGFGVLVLLQRPLLSSFIFGLVVWHGKMLCLLLVAAILLGNLLSQRSSPQKMAKDSLSYAAMFILPLLLWIGWIYLMLGGDGVQRWFSEQLHFWDQMKSMHNASADFSLASLKARFHSPQLEWAGFTWGTKIKNLLFSFGAIGVTLISLWLAEKKKLRLSSGEKGVILASSVSIGIYSIQYFFFHPFMWQRHFHPALYVGFALWVYWATKWARFYSLGFRHFFVVTVFLIALQAYKAQGHPLLDPVLSYSRNCTNLHSYLCDPLYYKK